MLHGAILSEVELALLRQITDAVHVHCAVVGLAHPPLRPIFEPGRLTVQPTMWGFAGQQFALLSADTRSLSCLGSLGARIAAQPVESLGRLQSPPDRCRDLWPAKKKSALRRWKMFQGLWHSAASTATERRVALPRMYSHQSELNPLKEHER